MNRHLMATRSSNRSSYRRCGVCIMLLAAPLFLASSAYADLISIGLQNNLANGGALTTVATGSGAVSVGPITYGSFSTVQVSAQDRIALGEPDLLNSQTLNVSSSSLGTLNVWVTAQGLSETGDVVFLSSFAVNALRGSIISVTERTFFSPTNALYAGTPLNLASFMGIGTAGPLSTVGAVSGTFSVTEQYTIIDRGAAPGNSNLTIDLAGVIPEPASIGLVGAGLLGIFAMKFRR